MPYQRAFVSFDKGKETMIVESFLSGKKGDYVWLVPTPTVPTEIKPCNPHALSGLIEAVSPRIEDSITREPFLAFLALAFSALYFLTFALYFLNIRNQKRRFKFLFALLISVLILLGVAVLFPVFAQAKPGSHERGPAVASGQAGSYAYTVLSSKEPVEVLRYLATNGFTLDTETKEAIAKNAQKGWLLTVLRYKHPADGQAAPHPVRFKFKTNTPVYPMEMTGAGLSKLRLDLVVSMDQQAEVTGLRTVSATEYIRFDHPDVKPYVLEKGVVTFLRGDLGQGQMAEDMTIRSKPYKKTYHERWADKSTFFGRIVFNVLFLLPIAYLVLSILHAIKPRNSLWWKHACAWSALACVVAVPTYGLLKYQLIESDGSGQSDYYKQLGKTKESLLKLDGANVQYPFVGRLKEQIGKDNLGDGLGQCLVEPSGEGAVVLVFMSRYHVTKYRVTNYHGVYKIEHGYE